MLYTVFGAIGMGIAGLSIISGLFSLLFANAGLEAVILGLFMAIGFSCMLGKGIGQRARLGRAERYLQLCGYKMYGTLEELAKQTQRSVRFVRRDLRKMLKLGFFPEGHLDDQETCFMLNDTVYYQYQQTASAYRQAEESRAMEGSGVLAGQGGEEQRAGETELDVMVAEGMEYTRKLRELNDDIPGEPISGKL